MGEAVKVAEGQLMAAVAEGAMVAPNTRSVNKLEAAVAAAVRQPGDRTAPMTGGSGFRGSTSMVVVVVAAVDVDGAMGAGLGHRLV